MKMAALHYILLIFFLITALNAENQTSDDCEEKEKPMALFDIAKNVLTKVKLQIPNCGEKSNLSHPNISQCGEQEKTAAFIDGILGLIEDAREKFPACKSNITNPEEDFNEKPTEKPTEIPDEKPTEKPTELPDEKPTEKPDEKTIETPTGKDCLEIRQKGFNESGVYTIQLNMTNTQNKSLDVYCDMDTDGGGWTVIQRRAKYSTQENFDRGWMDYKQGFGNLSQEFWIGNDIIHALTNTDSNSVRFDMRDITGDTAYAFYKSFNVANETDGYRLSIGNYSGNAGEQMEFLNKRRFSTRDKLNDGDSRCPNERKGGWWYYGCAWCNPNGLYRPGEKGDHTIFWNDWKGREGLSFFEIKTRNSYFFQ